MDDRRDGARVAAPLTTVERRLGDRLTREDDGSPDLGGPGPTPRKPRPTRLRMRCRCGAATPFDPDAMLNAWWMDDRRKAYLAARADAPLGPPSADDPSWDLDCARCGAPMRLRFEVSEWGKMSSYFPDVFAVIEEAD